MLCSSRRVKMMTRTRVRYSLRISKNIRIKYEYYEKNIFDFLIFFNSLSHDIILDSLSYIDVYDIILDSFISGLTIFEYHRKYFMPSWCLSVVCISYFGVYCVASRSAREHENNRATTTEPHTSAANTHYHYIGKNSPHPYNLKGKLPPTPSAPTHPTLPSCYIACSPSLPVSCRYRDCIQHTTTKTTTYSSAIASSHGRTVSRIISRSHRRTLSYRIYDGDGSTLRQQK